MHELQATTRAYIATLLTLAVGLTVLVFVARDPFLPPATIVAAFVAAGCMAAAWMFPVTFAPRTKLYVDTAVTVAAVLLLPPAPAAAAVGIGTLVAHAARDESRDWAQALFNAAQAMLVTLAAALILALAGWNPLQPSFASPRLILIIPFVATVMYMLNVFLVTTVAALEVAQPIGQSFRAALGEDFKAELLAHASLVCTGVLAAMVARAYGWGVALLAIPAITIHVALQHLARSRQAAERARVTSDASLAEAQRLARLGSWEWQTDADRWVWSDEVYRLLGSSAGAIHPSRATLLARIPPADRDLVDQAFSEARRGHKPFDIEHRVHLPDGGTRFVHQRAAPREENGHGGHFLGTIQDVTERVLAEQAMREATEAAQEADRAKSQLLSMASHDLRTPLTAIQGYIEIIVDGAAGDLNPEQRALLETAHRNSLHLVALINDLLDLSRIGAGRLPLQLRHVDVSEAVRHPLQRVAPEAAAKGVTLEVALGDGEPLALADPTRLDQMLQNLVSNAIKFTEQGTVTISVTTNGNWVEIAVADTGIGIPPEWLPRIFDEFSQGGEDARRRGGAGLGLSIVKQFAELHGGTVTASSGPGKGSTFTLRLPAAPVEPVLGSQDASDSVSVSVNTNT